MKKKHKCNISKVYVNGEWATIPYVAHFFIQSSDDLITFSRYCLGCHQAEQ